MTVAARRAACMHTSSSRESAHHVHVQCMIKSAVGFELFASIGVALERCVNKVLAVILLVAVVVANVKLQLVQECTTPCVIFYCGVH